MAGNLDVLRAENVLDLAQKALQGDGSVEYSLKTPYEAVALIGHACMLAVNFRLVGLGEEHTIGLYFLDYSCAVIFLVFSAPC